jgi:hypothetical protein
MSADNRGFGLQSGQRRRGRVLALAAGRTEAIAGVLELEIRSSSAALGRQCASAPRAWCADEWDRQDHGSFGSTGLLVLSAAQLLQVLRSRESYRLTLHAQRAADIG